MISTCTQTGTPKNDTQNNQDHQDQTHQPHSVSEPKQNKQTKPQTKKLFKNSVSFTVRTPTTNKSSWLILASTLQFSNHHPTHQQTNNTPCHQLTRVRTQTTTTHEGSLLAVREPNSTYHTQPKTGRLFFTCFHQQPQATTQSLFI